MLFNGLIVARWAPYPTVSPLFPCLLSMLGAPLDNLPSAPYQGYPIGKIIRLGSAQAEHKSGSAQWQVSPFSSTQA